MAKNKQKMLRLDYVTSAIKDVVNDTASNDDQDIGAEVQSFRKYNELFQDKLLNFTIGEGTSKFGDRVMSGISQTRSFLHIAATPSKQLVQKKAAFFKQAIDNGVDVEKNTKLLKQTEMVADFTGTAMVFQTWRDKDKSIVDTFVMSQDLHENLASAHAPDSENYDKALMAIVAHEHDGHILAGDVENGKWNSGDSKNLSPQDLNVLFDLRINSGLKANGAAEGNALQEVMPNAVWGESIKKWLGTTNAIIETVHNTDGNSIDPDELKRNIINRTGDEISNDNLKKTIDQLDVAATKKKINKVIGDAGSLDTLIKPHIDKALKISNGFALPADEIKKVKNMGFNDWTDVLQKQIVDYQNKQSGGFAHDSMVDIYDTLKGLIVGKPSDGNGDGHPSDQQGDSSGEGPLEKGNAGPSTDDSDAYSEVHQDDLSAAKTKTRNARKNIKSQIGKNRQAGQGTESVDIDLQPNKNERLTKGVKNILRKFGNYLSTKQKIDRVILPIVPAEQVGKIFAEHSSGLRPTAQLPLGAIGYKKQPNKVKGVIMTVTDESGSVSDKELAAMKTSIMDICDSQNLVAVNIAASGNIEKASIQAYQPGKTSKKDFLKRFKSGGTDDFLSGLYDLDEHMQNEKFKTKMDSALTETDISSSDLLNFRNDHKMNQIVFTDGGLFKKTLSEQKQAKWTEYASHFSEPPVNYVSITNTFSNPIKNGQNKFYGVYKFPLT